MINQHNAENSDGEEGTAQYQMSRCTQIADFETDNDVLPALKSRTNRLLGHLLLTRFSVPLRLKPQS